MLIPQKIEFPPVQSIADHGYRPFWSVMIPTYNGTQYLEQTLQSVLEQDPGTEEMQIEVIDDCSTKDDPKAVVDAVGKGRISFFRQPQNIGQIKNWNACIQRARGHWVQTLHQDDFVMPGFYSHLRAGIESEPEIGAAFCRHYHVNEQNESLFLSLLERETPGILTDWIRLIGVMQRIQFPSVVIKRSTLENLGGFCPQARSVADWEMWKRIAANYPIWYEPQILACFRIHSASESSRLIKTGENVADTRRAIEIAKSYLPDTSVAAITSQAYEHYAIHAIHQAGNLIDRGDLSSAFAQIREALKCSLSSKVMRSLASLVKYRGKNLISNAFHLKASR